MQLAQHLTPSRVLIDPEVAGRDELFRLYGEVFHRDGLIPSPDSVTRRLLEREAILSTGIGGGVAIPHAQVPGIGRLAMAASVHPGSLDYPSLDGQPVRLGFCLIGDTGTTADHLAGLARLARIARRSEALEALIAATDGEVFLETLRRLEGG